MKFRHTLLGVIPATCLVEPSLVKAEQYLTVEQAQQVMFPQAASFQKVSITLTKDQVKQLEKTTKSTVRSKTPPIWQATGQDGSVLGLFMVDEVYGKHEYITYATAIDPNGTVKSVEIMDYRETYGGEIRNPAWRQQFVGKSLGNELKLKEDIENISGATLSCKHVTQGVKKLLLMRKIALVG